MPRRPFFCIGGSTIEANTRGGIYINLLRRAVKAALAQAGAVTHRRDMNRGSGLGYINPKVVI